MKRLFAVLGDLLSNAFSSRFDRELVTRPQPDDQAFYELITAAVASPRTSRSGFGRCTSNNSATAGRVCDQMTTFAKPIPT